MHTQWIRQNTVVFKYDNLCTLIDSALNERMPVTGRTSERNKAITALNFSRVVLQPADFNFVRYNHLAVHRLE
jgi:hypothetical protein